MVAHILKYTAQEKHAYIVGILKASTSPRSIQHELATTERDMLANGWDSTPTPHTLYDKKTGRTISLYIEQLIIEEL